MTKNIGDFSGGGGQSQEWTITIRKEPKKKQEDRVDEIRKIEKHTKRYNGIIKNNVQTFKADPFLKQQTNDEKRNEMT